MSETAVKKQDIQKDFSIIWNRNVGVIQFHGMRAILTLFCELTDDEKKKMHLNLWWFLGLC
jgi:hypothetical protein